MPTAGVALDGLVLDANDAFGRLLGQSSATLVGRQIIDLCVDGAAPMRLFLDVAAGIDGGEIELDLRAADAASLHTTVVWTVTRDARGVGEHVTLVCADVSP